MIQNLVIIILSAIMGWFILEGIVNAKHVITRDQDDMHWIAAAAITSLLFFIIALSLSACNLLNY
jgi:hypothetical protein